MLKYLSPQWKTQIVNEGGQQSDETPPRGARCRRLAYSIGFSLGSPVTPYKERYPFAYCSVLIRRPQNKKGKRVPLGYLVLWLPDQPLPKPSLIRIRRESWAGCVVIKEAKTITIVVSMLFSIISI